MSNSMISFSMVLGITSICLWLFAMFVFASLIHFLRKYMKSYYDEFFFKVFCQSFSTGIYIFVIIISSWATVIYIKKMEKNEESSDIPKYWLIATEVTSFNLLVNCFAITVFVVFKVPLNFFQIFNRHPITTFSYYQ